MYLPEDFSESDAQKIISFAKQNAFATVVTSHEGVPFASHLPLLVEGEETISLLGHMAKANEQSLHLEDDADVLVIFHGPHDYISPSVFETPGFPTWNYAVVHMYGKTKVITEEEKVKAIIGSLTDKYEQSQANPWLATFPDKVFSAIVGFEIKVERIEAKYKLSQNRSVADRTNIISSLQERGTDSARAVASLMEEV